MESTILNRLAEVIGTHVVTENLARLLFTYHQGRACEADKRGVG